MSVRHYYSIASRLPFFRKCVKVIRIVYVIQIVGRIFICELGVVFTNPEAEHFYVFKV